MHAAADTHQARVVGTESASSSSPRGHVAAGVVVGPVDAAAVDEDHGEEEDAHEHQQAAAVAPASLLVALGLIEGRLHVERESIEY
jgi:hypothetical protein